VPFLHIADTTARAVAASGLTRVGLLATAFTMEEAFYVERFASYGVEVVTPDAEDRSEVSRIIYEQLCHNDIRGDSRRFYVDVVERMGCAGVILGCTEVELLIRPGDVGVPVFPTTQLHVAAAVDFALSDSELPASPD